MVTGWVIEGGERLPVFVQPVLEGVDWGGLDDSLWEAVPCCSHPVWEEMATDVESKSALLKLQGGTSEAVVRRRVLKTGSLGAVHAMGTLSILPRYPTSTTFPTPTPPTPSNRKPQVNPTRSSFFAKSKLAAEPQRRRRKKETGGYWIHGRRTSPKRIDL
jgi:hypothetical protein